MQCKMNSRMFVGDFCQSYNKKVNPVDSIIGDQAFQNGRSYICFSLGLDKVETRYNLLMELKCSHQMLNCSYLHWFACG